MYNLFVNAHSILRWILALSLIFTIIYAVIARSKNEAFGRTRMMSLITLSLVHLQFILGLILYFISPKVIFSALSMKAPLTRFFLVEHVVAMLIAITLITIGYSSAKKAFNDAKSYNRILIFYVLGFLIILAAIPWPFYNLGTGWI